jgi:hypothetical protein
VSDLAAISEPLARFSVAVEDALPLVARAAVILLFSWIAARMLRRGCTVALRRTRSTSGSRARRERDRSAARARSSPSRSAWSPTGWCSPSAWPPPSSRSTSCRCRRRSATPSTGHRAPARHRLGIIILAGGGLLAWLARRVVRSLLESAGFDRLVRRLDIGRTLERVSPSALVGLAAMLFVLAEAVIAALDQLHLTGLSAPMTAAMTEIGAALPDVGLGFLILVVGHFAGRLARRWVERLADELRIDAVLERIGVLRVIGADGGDGAHSTSSRVLGVPAAYILVLLVAAQAGLRRRRPDRSGPARSRRSSPSRSSGSASRCSSCWSASRSHAGAEHIAARRHRGAETASWVGGATRIMVLVFAFTMAIHHLGVAERFVTMAFGFAFGGLCLALALAFGLGGREITADSCAAAGRADRDQGARRGRRAARGHAPVEPI